MIAKGFTKSLFALALAASVSIQGLSPVFAADGSAGNGGANGSGGNSSNQSTRSGLHDNSKLGEVDGVDAEGLTIHFPSVFDTYIPGKIANAGGKPPLLYRGGITANGITGGVSAAPKVYLIFWGSQWGAQGLSAPDASGVQRATFTNDPKGVAPYVQSLLAGLGTNSETWSSVLAQYCDGVAVGATTCAGNAAAHFVGYPTGGALAGVWYDNTAVAPTTASQLQIAAEGRAGALHFGNLTPASNASTQYVVVSATGMHPNGFNAGANWCAWHDYATDPTVGNYAYTNLPYIPDMGASCGGNYVNGTDGALDGVGIVEGHEYAETVTDQWPAGGWTDANGYENGDDCAWTGPTGGQGGNLQLATGTFSMQGTWSNAINNCAMGAPNVITAGLPAPKTGSAFATTAVSGGLTPYAYSSVSGSLPTGLTLGTDGRITGTATGAAGTYTQTLTVTDSTGAVTTGTITLNLVQTVVTSVALSASTTSATTTTPVVLTATLTATGGNAAGQSITFKDGTTILGTALTDASGIATFSKTFTGGAHSVTASFAATGNYLASTSTAVAITVAAGASSLLLSATNLAPNPTTSVTLTATISPVISSATITFYDGTTNLGTARTSTAGVATLAKTFAAGTHNITAQFAGSTAALGSTSNAVTVVSAIAVPGAPTSPKLTASTTVAGQATATWTAPTSTGGSAITSYNVYVYQAGVLLKTVAGPTTRSLTLTGLTSKSVLTIKVTAINVAGEGPQSAASATATIK